MMNDDYTPKILYIAGYGRSGSTLLSILLDNLPGMVGMGGVGGLSRYLGVQGRECSCNCSYVECPVWSKTIQALPGGIDFIKELGVIQRQIEPWSKGLTGPVKEEIRGRYARKIAEFFRTVARTRGANILVDASKCAYPYMWRALSLSQVSKLDVFIIHLVRDAREVVASRKKGRNIDLERGKAGRQSFVDSSIGFAGWLTANLAAWYTRRRFESSQSMVVTYEDLVQSPEMVAQQIISRAKLSEIDPSAVFEKRRSLEVGHLVGSNRMARKSDIVEIDPSRSSVCSLSKFEKFSIRGISPIDRLVKME